MPAIVDDKGFSSQCKLHGMCFYIMFVYEMWEGEGFSSQCKLHNMFLYNICALIVGRGRDSLVSVSYTACFYIMFVYELWVKIPYSTT